MQQQKEFTANYFFKSLINDQKIAINFLHPLVKNKDNFEPKNKFHKNPILLKIQTAYCERNMNNKNNDVT
ncbi:MAG: hypothetical protein WCK67_13510 [bacterium]